MEEELNYLSEKIATIEQRVDEIEAHLKKGNGCGGRIGEGYRCEVVELKEEKKVLNNILSALTLVQMEKSGTNKRADDLDKNINWK